MKYVHDFLRSKKYFNTEPIRFDMLMEEEIVKGYIFSNSVEK